jgi:response regulator RpfG family c-di-GMP phosphodiesterase
MVIALPTIWPGIREQTQPAARELTMSIRFQQLVLLLGIALLPVVISGWQSLRQIDAMAAGIEDATRRSELQRERHYMREKVADIGTSLRLISSATERFLAEQSLLLGQALQSPPPDAPPEILYSHEVAGQTTAQYDRRFERATNIEDQRWLKVDYTRPSFLLTEPDCGTECQQAMDLLNGAARELQAIYESSEQFSLWHYAGLENGVSMVYPAHGDYPDDYDPRNRPWYRAAQSRGALTWLPLTIDASTGQPVLTAAAPLKSGQGTFLGATAIDLPLRQLLYFQSAANPWLSVARLALLQQDDAGDIRVIAMKEPLAIGSDWRSGEQTLKLEGIPEQSIAQVKKLNRGESRLLEAVSISNAGYTVAITAMNNAGTSWLALLSPHSATEAAVAAAVEAVEQEREQTLQRHGIGALMLVVLVVLVALYFSRRVTAPLISMSETAENLAAGRLDSRTGVQRSDEIGKLSASIDRMADSIEQLQLEQEKAYRDMIMSLHRALEKKDAYTAGHSGRVTRTAMKLGKRIGLDDKTMEILRFGALTHDLGKIGIADAILNKPADLNDEEYRIMQQHPTFSRTIMKPLIRFEEYAEIAGSHHEHWDGSGYPEGLKGEEIHLLARIVAIADAWDSMVGDRVYRKGMPVEKALGILEGEQDDGQFDPTLIREFIGMIRDGQAGH